MADLLLKRANEGLAELCKSLAREFAEPPARAGLAAAMGTTVLLARSRVPFPVVLFVALTAGQAAEIAWKKYLAEDDANGSH